MRMRTKMLAVTAALLVVPGFAFATAQAQDQEQPGSMDSQQPGMEQSGRTATSPSSGMENAEVFRKADNFKVEGTIASVDQSRHNITVQRKDLPPAELKVTSDTKIEVNGKTASLQELQPGTEVRAEFNLAENQPIAVSLDAKQSKEQRKAQEQQKQRAPSGGSESGAGY